MNIKVAKLSEHSSNTIKLPEMPGNGELPAYCKCKGFLDFVRIGTPGLDHRTALKCRECDLIIEIE
jgi:hypothetical protein